MKSLSTIQEQMTFHSHCFVVLLNRIPFGQTRLVVIVLIHWKYRPYLQLMISANNPV